MLHELENLISIIFILFSLIKLFIESSRSFSCDSSNNLSFEAIQHSLIMLLDEKQIALSQINTLNTILQQMNIKSIDKDYEVNNIELNLENID